jgi:GTPase involved in cell partitioning and DNA repair
LFRHQKNKQLSEYEVESSKFNQDSFWNEISQFWFSVQADDDGGGGGGGGGDGSSIIIELQAMMTMGLTHIALHCRDQ